MNQYREYLEWRYPDGGDILTAYRPLPGTVYPAGHPAAGHACSYWGGTHDNIERAVAAVAAIEKKGYLAMWASVHRALPDIGRHRQHWQKWEIPEMQSYQFLELDFDNILPPLTMRGCATEAELSKIVDHAAAVSEDLQSRGLPQPLGISTGNGCLLSFPICLPTTPENRNLMTEVGAALALAYDRPYCGLDLKPA